MSLHISLVKKAFEASWENTRSEPKRKLRGSKSELFCGGYDDIEKAVLSSITGIKLGSFPTRYLGLPLNPSRISSATLQPFVERITAKLHSWTVKPLSFAGKIRLVASVVYGMVNFWSSVFVLPKSFYQKIDSLCAAFLWRNKTDSAAGARVAWKDICRPKPEGGLGIRLLEDFALVFRLKLVWNFFTNTSSIWVAWVKRNMFGRKTFWMMEDSPRFSATLRSMLQLKDSLREYMRCEIGNGITASFWSDSWCELGPLLLYLGTGGPRALRLRLDASVNNASRNGSWNLPSARSQRVETLQITLTSLTPPSPAAGADRYLWIQANGDFGNTFSSRVTWDQILLPLRLSTGTRWYGLKSKFREALFSCG
ncbi:unnamed protein product [Microthlaspi erraticum]|uniref:Reverse transcriptase zinc-binding domain-containing protein n=1 Tax=Microthlaspi erraticum TaxID=1685480 RepID=A0A6D2K1P7_9BRAS|nr:unnamed protein product [Microthlaspi erraticum]CAA7045967.1 unnamed protein product [Microthlaspi erraticum]